MSNGPLEVRGAHFGNRYMVTIFNTPLNIKTTLILIFTRSTFVILTISSDYFPKQLYLVGLYNRGMAYFL
jgi:hypothetical protein